MHEAGIIYLKGILDRDGLGPIFSIYVMYYNLLLYYMICSHEIHGFNYKCIAPLQRSCIKQYRLPYYKPIENNTEGRMYTCHFPVNVSSWCN